MLEKIRSTYCNQLFTNNLDFCNFLFKLANCPQITKERIDHIQNYDFIDVEKENTYYESYEKGAIEMEEFIRKYHWSNFVSIFCSGLTEINHQMKSILLNNNLIKYSNQCYFHEGKKEEKKEIHKSNSVELSIQSKLYKICDSKRENQENNFNLNYYCEELSENREAIFYFSHLNKYIKIKAEKKYIALHGKNYLKNLQLFYKELNENNWNRFYKEDNVEHNIKEINYEKGKKRNNIELQEFKKRKWEEEENEEREYKKEKLSVMDISKVKEIFELNTTDELFIEMLLKVMKAYTLVVTSSAGIVCYFCNYNIHCIRVAVQNYATKRPNHY